MKRIGLAIAAAMLGTTGVASAAIAAHQFTLASDSSHSAGIDAKTENLAANCWAATGAGKTSGCSTNVSNPTLPKLPGLEDATGLVDAGQLVADAKAHYGSAASGAASTGIAAAGGLPVHCDIVAGVPVPKAVTEAAKPVDDALKSVPMVGGALATAKDTVGSATGTHVDVNTAGSSAAGCGASTSGNSKAVSGQASTAGSTGTSAVQAGGATAGKTLVDAGHTVAGITNDPAGTVNGAVSTVTGAAAGTPVGGLLNQVNGIVGGGLPIGSCSANGSTYGSGGLGLNLSGGCK